MLYTITGHDGDFTVTSDQVHKTIEFVVNDDTAYRYIRIYDSQGSGYTFSDVQIYRESAGYNDTFEALLNLSLPKAEL